MRLDENLPSETDEHFKKCLIAKKEEKKNQLGLIFFSSNCLSASVGNELEEVVKTLKR